MLELPGRGERPVIASVLRPAVLWTVQVHAAAVAAAVHRPPATARVV